MATTERTYKATLRYQDWQSTEDCLLHAGRARRLGIDLTDAERQRDESVRYATVFVEARNIQRARRVALEDRGTGWSVLDIEACWPLPAQPSPFCDSHNVELSREKDIARAELEDRKARLHG